PFGPRNPVICPLYKSRFKFLMICLLPIVFDRFFICTKACSFILQNPLSSELSSTQPYPCPFRHGFHPIPCVPKLCLFSTEPVHQAILRLPGFRVLKESVSGIPSR